MAVRTSLVFETKNPKTAQKVSEALKSFYEQESTEQGGNLELNTDEPKRYFAIYAANNFVAFRPNNPEYLMNRVLGAVQERLKEGEEVTAVLSRDSNPYFEISITPDLVSCVAEYELKVLDTEWGFDYIRTPLEEAVRIRVNDKPIYSKEEIYNAFRQGIMQGIVEVGEKEDDKIYIRIGAGALQIDNCSHDILPIVLGEYFMAASRSADYMQLDEMMSIVEFMYQTIVLGGRSERALEELMVDIDNRMENLEKEVDYRYGE